MAGYWCFALPLPEHSLYSASQQLRCCIANDGLLILGDRHGWVCVCVLSRDLHVVGFARLDIEALERTPSVLVGIVEPPAPPASLGDSVLHFAEDCCTDWQIQQLEGC